MAKPRRSDCPIASSLDLLGDRWSLLILRDIFFAQKKYFGEFLASPEGIATNILANRLERLERSGLVSKLRDPRDRKRYAYQVTAKGFETLPILLELILWGAAHDPSTTVPADYLERVREDRDELVSEIRARLEPTSGE